MRFIVYGVIISVLMLASTEHVGAQDDLQPASIYWWHGGNPIELSLETNVCPEDIIATNPHLVDDWAQTKTYYDLIWWDGNIFIQEGPLFLPPHTPCYKSLEGHNLIDDNICEEEVVSQGVLDENGKIKSIPYARYNALPCFNAQGYRLEYYSRYQLYAHQPFYKEMPYLFPPADICVGHLTPYNPSLYNYLSPSPYIFTDHRQFIPPNAQRCRSVEFGDLSLYDLSHRENVCMEIILEASGRYLYNWHEINFSNTSNDGTINTIAFIPLNAPACYDAEGKRLGHIDRTIHQMRLGESLLDVAKRYDVCLQDLWDENPALNFWTGWHWPEIMNLGVLYIPDTAPCEQTIVTFKTQKRHTLQAVSLLTNVCINRLIEANLQYPQLNDFYELQDFGDTLVLTIPNRLPCYNLEKRYSNPYMPIGYSVNIITYVCTSVDTSKGVNLAGHTPPVTTSYYDATQPFCVPRTMDMTVYYENIPYMLYKVRGWETYISIGQCFGIDAYELINLNARQYPQAVKPPGTLLIPQPYNTDCWMLGKDIQNYYKHYLELTYKAGYLIDGVYTVNYGDTLSSIGHKFGYLPQWIADASNLSDPGMIYFLQELKMPAFPSFYTLVPVGGAAGFTVLVSTAIYRLRRWRRNRYSSKKKNNAA